MFKKGNVVIMTKTKTYWKKINCKQIEIVKVEGE